MVGPATKCCGGKLSFLSPLLRLCCGCGPARFGYASISLLALALLQHFPSPQRAQNPSGIVSRLADWLTSERDLVPVVHGRSGQRAPYKIFDATWQRSSIGGLKKSHLPAVGITKTCRELKPA